MKYALISPSEKVLYISASVATGEFDIHGNEMYEDTFSEKQGRIAEISANTFEVASPLFWVECADDVTSQTHYFDSATNTIQPLPSI